MAYYKSADGTLVLPNGVPAPEGFTVVTKTQYDAATAALPAVAQQAADIAAFVTAGIPEDVVRRMFGLEA